MAWQHQISNESIQNHDFILEHVEAMNHRGLMLNYSGWNGPYQLDPRQTMQAYGNGNTFYWAIRDFYAHFPWHWFVQCLDDNGALIDPTQAFPHDQELYGSGQRLKYWWNNDVPDGIEPALWLYVTQGASDQGPSVYHKHPRHGGQPIFSLDFADWRGAILGPWVFEELRRFLNLMRWTLADHPGLISYTGEKKFAIAGDDQTTMDEAKAQALAEFDSIAPTPSIEPARSIASLDTDWGENVASLEAVKNNITITPPNAGLARQVHMFHYAMSAWSFRCWNGSILDGGFDPAGQSLARDKYWHFTSSPVLGPAEPFQYSTGSFDQVPSWPPIPLPEHNSSERGWATDDRYVYSWGDTFQDPVGIVCWDVDGGLGSLLD